MDIRTRSHELWSSLIDLHAQIDDAVSELAKASVHVRSNSRPVMALAKMASVHGQDAAKAVETLAKSISRLEDVIVATETVCKGLASEASNDAKDFHASTMVEPTIVHALHDQAVRRQVWELTGGVCAYCSTQLVDGGGEGNQFCIEHVVPRSLGGPDHIANYVPSCRSCNNSKGDRHVLVFIQRNLPRRIEIRDAAE